MRANPLNAAAMALITAAACLSPFLFVLSLPWNDLGLWSQVESATVGLHVLSAAAAVGLALLVSAGDGRGRAAVLSAPVLALAALGVLGLAAAPLVDSPWRSVHGTLKHGIGAIWHVELAVLAAAFAVLRGTKAGTAAAVSVGAAAAAIILAYALPRGIGPGLPLSFEEWVGIMASAAGLGLLAHSRRFGIAAFVIMASGYAVSGNRSVLLALVAAGALWAILRIPRLRLLLDRRPIAASVPVVIAVVGAVVLWAAAPLVERAARDAAADAPLAGSHIPSRDPIDRVETQRGSAGTLWSRSHMLRAAVASTAEHPVRLVSGQGWGSFPSISIGAVRDVPGRMMEKAPPTASRTYWDVLDKANFHVHNMTVEALVSAGLPGAVLWLAFLGCLAASSRTGLYLSVGTAVVGTFWFPVNILTPMLALAVAGSLPRAGRAGTGGASVAGGLAAMGLLLAAAGAMASAMGLFSLARIEHGERYFQGVVLPADGRTCTAVTAPGLPEVDVNVDLYRMLVQRIEKAVDPKAELAERTTNILSFSCAMRRYWQDRGSVSALAASLELRTRLLDVSPAAAPILVSDILKWREDVEAILSVAPRRTDFAVPYIAEMRTRVGAGTVADEAERLSARMSDADPVKHWLLSVADGGRGNDASARDRIGRALELGFANLFRVDPSALPAGE